MSRKFPRRRRWFERRRCGALGDVPATCLDRRTADDAARRSSSVEYRQLTSPPWLRRRRDRCASCSGGWGSNGTHRTAACTDQWRTGTTLVWRRQLARIAHCWARPSKNQPSWGRYNRCNKRYAYIIDMLIKRLRFFLEHVCCCGGCGWFLSLPARKRSFSGTLIPFAKRALKLVVDVVAATAAAETERKCLSHGHCSSKVNSPRNCDEELESRYVLNSCCGKRLIILIIIQPWMHHYVFVFSRAATYSGFAIFPQMEHFQVSQWKYCS